MTRFASLPDLHAACLDLPSGDDRAASLVAAREAQLTKPSGSLGRLEDLAIWLGRWQARSEPRLEQIEILVFAGNHGVVAQGVSPYPAEVTRQMVANFDAGGAAINQLARTAGAKLQVVPLSLDEPTKDFSTEPALSEAEFLGAVATGHDAVSPGTDLLCLGEMGIGNTTAAAAICAALFGGGGERWAGRGTGIDDKGLARKRAVIDAALMRHKPMLTDPLAIAVTLGGRELAAIFGATLAARRQGIPVLLDGFVCTAAVAPFAKLRPGALDHTQVSHVSAEAGHRALIDELQLSPLLNLGMRLGEASGAAVAALLLRAALACHVGMATFAEAGVTNKDR
ncbi:MAG TPA: nicotinate-nucleotide--dimethylbenzimidazole phosphoribosyltransferase [Xanthobacteraceae bacterium]|jgi:nicotinate-nucleotide--dimethylbenzimidazole phosphoribosyltransferase|nr:nicotinate-nucleotide--dimethylbenzimidazole phosphoribosyltransferase [Xanthobacteraceae bacterium]